MAGAKRTICEINGRLVDIASEGPSAAHSRNVPQGAPVYPIVRLPRQPIERLQRHHDGTEGYLDSISAEPANGNGSSADSGPTWQKQAASYAKETAEEIQSYPVMSTLGWLRGSTKLTLPEMPPFAWHLYQQRMAVADSADRIHVFDIGAAGPTAVGSQSGASAPPIEAVVQHDHQGRVTALAWRPNSGSMLAIAGQGGVTLWNDNRAPSSTQRPRLLPVGRPVQLISLSWNPTGRLLAAAHADAAGFTVWDVALGTPTSLSAGQGPTPLLQWSPDGSYLLSGGVNGSFNLWDTDRWGLASWQTPGAGPLVGACWSPDSRSVLLAFANSRQLVMLYLLGQTPSLLAQLLPVELPQLEGVQGSTGAVIGSIDWDAHGERLAVAVGPGHAKAGTVALYATSYKPVMSVRFIGFIEQGEPAEGSQPPMVSFHRRYDKGALLGVRWGGGSVSTIPLLFRPDGSGR